MRKITVYIETGFAGSDRQETIEVDDDATEEEIDDIAREVFFNQCNYSWSESE